MILGAVGTLSAGLLSGLVPGTAMAENRLVSPSYGGGGGASFPMQFPRRIGARGGNVVDTAVSMVAAVAAAARSRSSVRMSTSISSFCATVMS